MHLDSASESPASPDGDAAEPVDGPVDSQAFDADSAVDSATDSLFDGMPQDGVTDGSIDTQSGGDGASVDGTLPLDAISEPAGSDPPPDAVASCTTPTDYSVLGDTHCSVGTTYACGIDSYRIECDCPPGTCLCYVNGSMVGAPAPYGFCPGCIAQGDYALFASVCGIPY